MFSKNIDMKKFALVVLLIMYLTNVYSQDVENMSIKSVVDACVSLRDAVSANDVATIKRSTDDLKSCNTDFFYTLECLDDTTSSLDGHLVFDETFVDMLVREGETVYQRSEEINRDLERGQTYDGSIKTKTCFVKAGQSTKYSFASKGRQELAVVAEAGGLVTMKIHVTNNSGLDKRYDDTEDVKIGRPQRMTCFDLPANKRNTVELEIINCGDKDCSFVVISN